MNAVPLGSAMVTKSPSTTPLVSMPCAMRLVRWCSSRQVRVTPCEVMAGASGFSATTSFTRSPMEMNSAAAIAAITPC
jgi:hypothetical protein